MVEYILILIFLFASVFFAMLGLGGGVLYTPLQLYVLNMPVQKAVANSLFIITAASLSAFSIYRKNRKIDYALGIILEVTTAMGAFTAGYLSVYIPESVIVFLLGLVLLIVSYLMIKGWKPTSASMKHPHFLVLKRHFGGHDYEVPLLYAVPLTFLAGSVSGLCGIAGGTIKVPLMTLLLGIPMDIAVATSTFMIGITSFFGLMGHVVHGNLEWKIALPLALAVVIGGNIGARIAVRTSREKLKHIFGWFLLLVSLSMFWRAFVTK